MQAESQFDPVVSPEFAGYLPANFVDEFVEPPVRLGPAILFSATAPFAGGQNHVNDQWPDDWIKRSFGKKVKISFRDFSG